MRRKRKKRNRAERSTPASYTKKQTYCGVGAPMIFDAAGDTNYFDTLESLAGLFYLAPAFGGRPLTLNVPKHAGAMQFVRQELRHATSVIGHWLGDHWVFVFDDGHLDNPLFLTLDPKMSPCGLDSDRDGETLRIVDHTGAAFELPLSLRVGGLTMQMASGN